MSKHEDELNIIIDKDWLYEDDDFTEVHKRDTIDTLIWRHHYYLLKSRIDKALNRIKLLDPTEDLDEIQDILEGKEDGRKE